MNITLLRIMLCSMLLAGANICAMQRGPQADTVLAQLQARHKGNQPGSPELGGLQTSSTEQRDVQSPLERVKSPMQRTVASPIGAGPIWDAAQNSNNAAMKIQRLWAKHKFKLIEDYFKPATSSDAYCGPFNTQPSPSLLQKAVDGVTTAASMAKFVVTGNK